MLYCLYLKVTAEVERTGRANRDSSGRGMAFKTKKPVLPIAYLASVYYDYLFSRVVILSHSWSIGNSTAVGETAWCRQGGFFSPRSPAATPRSEKQRNGQWRE